MIRDEFERLEKDDAVMVKFRKNLKDGIVIAKNLHNGKIFIKIDEICNGQYSGVLKHFSKVEVIKKNRTNGTDKTYNKIKGIDPLCNV